MNTQDITAEFASYYSSFLNLTGLQDRPLLAHYTSLSTVENIARTGEIWFSNPLFMNDLHEVRFGMIEGQKIFLEESYDTAGIAMASSGLVEAIRNAFIQFYNEFEKHHALNIYVFCLSQHDYKDTDGRLSMWRGYGGNGGGAAIVFRSDFLRIHPDSPLLFCKVIYATDEDRRTWIRSLVQHAKQLVQANNFDAESLRYLIFNVFHLIKLYSMAAKHTGFSEEQEWRIIYLPERDTTNVLKDGYTYVVGRNGVEPRLKFPVRPLPFEGESDWKFDDIVDRIILGPSLSSTLSTNAVKKMLHSVGRPSFAGSVVSSSIPFRSA